jgi:uncharacterized membrane protein
MSSSVPTSKSRWLAWLLGLSLLVNAGFLAGFIYHRYWVAPSVERTELVQQVLQLDPDQRAVLVEIQGEVRSEARAGFRAARQHHKELVQLMRQDRMDMPALERYLRATTEPQIAMQRDLILRLLKFRDALTPEQREIFDQKIERPGFMMRVAGMPGPMWRAHGCRRPPAGSGDQPPPDPAELQPPVPPPPPNP